MVRASWYSLYTTRKFVSEFYVRHQGIAHLFIKEPMRELPASLRPQGGGTASLCPATLGGASNSVEEKNICDLS